MDKNKRKPIHSYSKRQKFRFIEIETNRDYLSINEQQNFSDSSNSVPSSPVSALAGSGSAGVDNNNDELLSFGQPSSPTVDPDSSIIDSDSNSDILLSSFDSLDSNSESLGSPDSNNSCLLEPTTDETDRPSFQNDLAEWAINFNINHNALSSLLRLLNESAPSLNVPKDARTLLKTPRTVEIKPTGGGHYWHYGLANVLKLMSNDLKQFLGARPENISLVMNVDGLPLAKSSNICFWPILVSEPILNKVYIVGCFHGNEKPADSNEFMRAIVDELKYHHNNGYSCEDETDTVSTVCLDSLICDAPAKAFLMKVKGHAGYSSCTKCTIHGEFIANRVCFPTTNEHLQPIERTDESVYNMVDDDFHMGCSILQEIPNFGLVSQIPLDYMHLVCLGVTKKLLSLWLCGPLNVRLSGRDTKLISSNLIKFRESVPKEFQRKPRELQHFKHWKATEFRQFLIYTGPVVLKDHLKPDVYENFLALHVAITILTRLELIQNINYVNYAEELLKYFVKTFELIYGQHHVSHNVHGLLHLTNDVRKYGPLDKFSAFKFESYMSNLKKKVRKSELPLQQLAKRYVEEEIFNCEGLSKSVFGLKDEQELGPLSENLADNNNITGHFEKFCGENIIINCKDNKNNIFMFSDGSISKVINIVRLTNNGIVLVCSGHKDIGNLYSLDHFDSSLLNIKVVKEDRGLVKSYKLTEILCKMWRMEYGNSSVVVPLHRI